MTKVMAVVAACLALSAAMALADGHYPVRSSQHVSDSDFNNQVISCFQGGVEIIHVDGARNITMSYVDGELRQLSYYTNERPMEQRSLAVPPSLACRVARQ
ncbi:hypothetical protein [Chromobacterium sp. CV08]|uniref:hypothetical protein n=1 Tax=Chromobacterium sp. CV08 TaxID=3133274 RepID=UPI003DA98532